MVKLTGKLSTKSFVMSQIFILFLSLVFLGILHYVVNMQYVKPNKYSLRGPVTTAPTVLTLEVTAPDDNLLTFDPLFLVTGKTISKAQVLISSETSDKVVLANTDGTFSASFPITEGPNTITIIAFNQKGEQRSITRNIYYSKEKI